MPNTSNKRIAKNTLLLYIRMLFLMAVSLYTSRVVLDTLGIEDFGIYNVVGGFVSMFSFLNSAMASTTQRYLNFELGKGNVERLRMVFSTSINIHAAISIIILLLAETVGIWFLYTYMTIPEARFSAAMWTYQMVILSTVVMVMSVPYNAAIIAHEKMGAFAYISVMEVILKLAIVYVLLVFDFDKLKLYAVLMLAVQILIQIIYTAYCNRHFEETKYHRVWNGKLFREMTGFAGWNLFGNIAAVAFTQGLNVLLNLFFTPAVNAARGIAVQVQNALRGFCFNFQTALNPQIVKSYAANELEAMHSLIYRSTKFSFFLLLFISLPVLMQTETILAWWLKTVPEHTAMFVRLTLVASFIEVIGNPLITGAMANGRIKVYQMVVGGLLFMILPLSYLSLRLGFSPESVFVVQIFMMVISHIARVYMVRPMINLSVKAYLHRAISPLFIVSAVSIILPFIVNGCTEGGIIGFVFVCLACFLSVGTSSYWLGLDSIERAFVRTQITKILRKARGV